MMKKSDIITIIAVGAVGMLVSFFVVNALLGNPDDAYESYKTIEVIDAGLAEPDPEVFNSSAINPTIEVYVGDCEDVYQDGLLSQAELVACGRVDSVDVTDDPDETGVVENETEAVEEDVETGEAEEEYMETGEVEEE